MDIFSPSVVFYVLIVLGIAAIVSAGVVFAVMTQGFSHFVKRFFPN